MVNTKIISMAAQLTRSSTKHLGEIKDLTKHGHSFLLVIEVHRVRQLLKLERHNRHKLQRNNAMIDSCLEKVTSPLGSSSTPQNLWPSIICKKLAAFRKWPHKVRICYFRDKCLVFARNCKFANSTQHNMQYISCNSALLAQETLFWS